MDAVVLQPGPHRIGVRIRRTWPETVIMAATLYAIDETGHRFLVGACEAYGGEHVRRDGTVAEHSEMLALVWPDATYSLTVECSVQTSIEIAVEPIEVTPRMAERLQREWRAITWQSLTT